MGDGGLKPRGSKDEIREEDAVKPARDQLPEITGSIELSASDGVGPVANTPEELARLKDAISEPKGHKPWWDPHTDGDGKPFIPRTWSDAALVKALHSRGHFSLVTSVLDAERDEPHLDFSSDSRAVAMYEELKRRYLRALQGQKENYLTTDQLLGNSLELAASKLASLHTCIVGRRYSVSSRW